MTKKASVTEKKPLLIVVSGPSGAGKSTLVHALVKRRTRFQFVPGITTRPPERRKGGEHREHVFMTERKFTKQKKEGGFLENDQFLQFKYGTSRAAVEKVITRKKVPLLVLDVQGHNKIRRLRKFTVYSVFVTAGNFHDLRTRLLKRHPEMNRTRLQRRLAEARTAQKHSREYDRVLLNREGHFNEALERLITWIDRHRRLR